MDYDVAAAFEEIEADLIESMMRNLKRHRAEEDELGINWSQWQAEQLKALEEYKRHNAKKYGTKFNDINATLDGLIRKYREDGNTEQEAKILEAMKNGFKAEKAKPGVSAKFFKMNDRKIDALVNATTNDFKKAEIAILRRSNDQYRKIIFNAQMYAHMGGTYEKAVDMATKDFLRNGLKCVVYKNGSRHSLQDYADMALRTAQKRAYLTGEGEKRKEWGISTVIVNKRGNPCPLCAKWVGKVLVDDVWSGGSKDGKSNVTGVKYKTVSQAIAEGLYHPRCRDSHTTYFEGINTMPAEGYTREELKKLAEDYKGEQQQQYAERQAESYNRLAEYSLDEDNRRIYRARADEWEDRSFADGNKSELKETKKDDIMSLKNKISEQDSKIAELKNQFSDATDGYSYDEWFSEFSSIEEGYGDVPEGDTTFTKLKSLDEEIRNAEKQRSNLLLQKESRGQLDTGFPGKVPDDKLDEYNEKAFEQIKIDTGYSEEQTTEFHNALKEYFGGDYDSILTGEGSIAKTIRDGLDRMPVYDGAVYRGLCFSESSDYDISEFTRLKPGDVVPSKGIISSWSSDKRVAEAFGAASTQSAESSTVILECLENKTGVGVQHISSYGCREAEVLCGSKYEVLEIVTESKYDYVSKRKDLLYLPDDLTDLEYELKKQVVCVIKVKEV